MAKKPEVHSAAQKELDQAAKQIDAFESQVKELTQDRMNAAPKAEQEPQTKLSQKDLARSNEIWLKPERTIGCRDKFNEDYRDRYNFDKEYVQFIAEHKEIIGETIDIWTRPYGGMPAEFWKVPTNKPVWGPRYLAEQIKRAAYHRLRTEDVPTSREGNTVFTGSLVVDTTVQRLDAHPVNQRKSIFMGAGNF